MGLRFCLFFFVCGRYRFRTRCHIPPIIVIFQRVVNLYLSAGEDQGGSSGLVGFMLEPVEGDYRPDHRSVLPDCQQCVIRAGGIIGAALSPLVAEEVLIEENRRRCNFLQNALSPGRSCRSCSCPNCFPWSAEETFFRWGALRPEERSCQDNNNDKKQARRPVSSPLSAGGRKRKDPVILTARILLMKLKGGRAEMSLVHFGDLPQKGKLNMMETPPGRPISLSRRFSL